MVTMTDTITIREFNKCGYLSYKGRAVIDTQGRRVIHVSMNWQVAGQFWVLVKGVDDVGELVPMSAGDMLTVNEVQS